MSEHPTRPSAEDLERLRELCAYFADHGTANGAALTRLLAYIESLDDGRRIEWLFTCDCGWAQVHRHPGLDPEEEPGLCPICTKQLEPSRPFVEAAREKVHG